MSIEAIVWLSGLYSQKVCRRYTTVADDTSRGYGIFRNHVFSWLFMNEQNMVDWSFGINSKNFKLLSDLCKPNGTYLEVFWFILNSKYSRIQKKLSRAPKKFIASTTVLCSYKISLVDRVLPRIPE